MRRPEHQKTGGTKDNGRGVCRARGRVVLATLCLIFASAGTGLATTFLDLDGDLPGLRAGELTGDSRNISLRYEITVSGVYALSFAADIELADQAYQMETAAETIGVIGALYLWRMNALSTGLVESDRLRPQNHRTNSFWKNKSRTVYLSYDGEGNVTTNAVPPAYLDERDEVPPEMIRNTVDPMSGVLAAVEFLDDTQSCKLTVPVYDGRRRYDLVFDEAPPAPLERPGIEQLNATDVKPCRLQMNQITGFWRSPDVKGRYPLDGRVWMGKILEAVPPVPLKIEYEGRHGLVEIHLVRVASGQYYRDLPVEIEGSFLGLF